MLHDTNLLANYDKIHPRLAIKYQVQFSSMDTILVLYLIKLIFRPKPKLFKFQPIIDCEIIDT